MPIDLWSNRGSAESGVYADDFEWVDRVSVGSDPSMEPRMTIQSDGGVNINCAASALLFGDRAPDVAYVKLGYDKHNRRLGIVAVPEAHGAYRSVKSSKSGGYGFSAGSMLRKYGYTTGVARRWKAYSPARGMLYANLGDPFDTVSRAR